MILWRVTWKGHSLYVIRITPLGERMEIGVKIT